MTDTLSSQVLVGVTPTKLISKVAAGQQIMIRNRDAANSFFTGGSAVTAATGLEVKIGEQMAAGPFELPPETEIWGITATGTARADVFTVIGD